MFPTSSTGSWVQFLDLAEIPKDNIIIRKMTAQQLCYFSHIFVIFSFSDAEEK